MAACTQLFLDNLLVECGTNCSVVPDTDVHIHLVTRSQDLSLNWNTDETYTLEIVTNSRGRLLNIQVVTWLCRFLRLSGVSETSQ
jgi:hypothetical protein